jgi:hypothetical protein
MGSNRTKPRATWRSNQIRSMKTRTRLSSEELKDVIKYLVQNNQQLQAEGKKTNAVEIVGEAGLGKTSLIYQLADELNYGMVKLSLAQIEETADLLGFPIRQYFMTHGDNSLWVDEPATNLYAGKGYSFTGLHRMSYCPPEWIVQNDDRPHFLLLDDYSRAPLHILQAVMELVDRGEFLSWRLPKNWLVILTSNPDSGDYFVTTMDEAQRSRYISLEMKFDIDSWALWAENQKIDSRAINFMMMYHAEITNTSVNPRSLTTFFNAISSLSDFDKDLGLIKMIGDGTVGAEISTLFAQFIAGRLDKLITPKRMLLEDTWEEIVKEIKTIVGTGASYRADLASVLIRRLTNYTMLYANDNPITDATIKRIMNLVKEPDLFTNDLIYVFIKRLVNGNKIKFAKLMMDQEIQKIVLK